MREIKFRAWDEKRKDWDNLEWPWIEGFYDLNEGIKEWGSCDNLFFQQFTGLKDKNGVEIWEGDIVKWDYLGKELCVSEIFFSRGMFCVDPERKQDWYQVEAYLDQNLEVIGNIYENPELKP